MNAESNTTKPKSRMISIPFLLVAVVLVVGGYPAGKWAMEKIMTMQEQGKAASDPIPPDPDLKRTGIRHDGTAKQLGWGAGGPRGAGGGGGGGGGGFDPEAAFARMDADSNGKLEGEEISERALKTLSKPWIPTRMARSPKRNSWRPGKTEVAVRMVNGNVDRTKTTRKATRATRQQIPEISRSIIGHHRRLPVFDSI